MAIPRKALSPATLAALYSTPAPTPAPSAFVYRARAPKKVFKASPQQQAFFDWILDGKGNALLEAVAGAGKTTTLIQALSRMDGSIFFGAYNKKIADEIKVKAADAGVLSNNVFIKTMHGAGLVGWNRTHKDTQVDDGKVGKLIEAAGIEDVSYLALSAFIGKMVSFGKQFLIGVRGKTSIDNLDAWARIAKHFSVDLELPEDMAIEHALAYVVTIYKQSADSCIKVIDFDDMIFAPLYYNVKLFQNDWVLIDECQDVNPARLELARRMLKPAGRLVAVGDSRQAIYGFTGAGGDSVENIIKQFDCQRLPLTVTYRCPKAVVEYVHQWVSHIQAHPDAPEGVVRGLRLAQATPGSPVAPWFMQDAPTASDAILCRYTRPLIETAFSMIRNGVACKVEGRDIGNNLISLATRWKISSLDALSARLDIFLQREQAKAREAKNERKEQDVQDRVDTLRIFIERCRAKGVHKIEGLVAEIKALFADDVTGVVTLSTIHKAKGREWPRVFWIQAAQRHMGLQDWELLQEENMKYVAGTRAQEELILVPEKQG